MSLIPAVAAASVLAFGGSLGWTSISPGHLMTDGKLSGLGEAHDQRSFFFTGKVTPDGCKEYTTQGRLSVNGGSLTFTARPAGRCGAPAHPDAYYRFTIVAGTGTLEGASGGGTILADHGQDIWKGRLVTPKPLSSR